MGISVTKKPKTILRTITIKEPIDGSGFKDHKVKVSFEVIPRSEAEAITKEEGAPLIPRVLKGWGDPSGKGGFEDENGSPLEFNDDNLTAINDVPWINSGLVKAYFEVAYGGKLGN